MKGMYQFYFVKSKMLGKQLLPWYRRHCKYSGKSFSQKEHLKKHIQAIHKGHKNHKCNSCGKIFRDAEYLKQHIHAVHEEGQKDYKCESCGKSFSDAGSLKRHIPIPRIEVKTTLFKYIVNQYYSNHFS